MPALARCAAICAPITPEPSTAAFLICIVDCSPSENSFQFSVFSFQFAIHSLSYIN
jgi:hypothetical protein